MTEPDAATVVRPVLPVHLGETLGVFRRGPADPQTTLRLDGVWRAMATPAGIATVHVCVRPAGSEVAVDAWGDGAEWAVAQAPDLLGARDSLDGFDPGPPEVAELHRRHPGLRFPRSGLVLDALVPSVLEQKVTGVEAFRAWRQLVRRFGRAAPQPPGAPPLMAPPDAAGWMRLAVWDWHRCGVEARRAEVIRAAAHRAARLEECVEMSSTDAQRRLRSLPGIGPWTAAEVAQRAFGDPDAVSVGDYHLPSIVGHYFTGEPTDDAGMLELLAPWPGHRQRVVRLIELSGVRPPRRGPRAPVRSFRAI